MIRLRFVTLAAVAVVAGAVIVTEPLQCAVGIFLALSGFFLLYVVQTRYTARNVVRVAISLLFFWSSFLAGQRALHALSATQLPVETTTIEGTVRSQPAVENNDKMVFQMVVSSADDTRLKRTCVVEVVLPDKRTAPLPGQSVIARGHVRTPSLPLNPGEERSEPAPSTQFLASDFQCRDRMSPAVLWGRWSARIRNRAEGLARGYLSYQAYGLLEELLLHQKAFRVSERHLFSATGTSHVLSISGLHLSLAYLLLALLIRHLFPADDLVQTIISLVGTFVYLAFIDFPLSADRAFVMLAVVAVSRLFGVHSSALVSLSWAALLLTIIDPLSVFDIGLRLSFASVAGLLFIGEPLSRHIRTQRRWLLAVWSSACSTAGASLPAAALTIPLFHAFAPVAFLANMAVIPMVSLLLPSLLVWTVTALVFPPLASLAAPILNLTAQILFGLLKILERIPWSHLNAATPSPWFSASIMVCLGVTALLTENQYRLEVRHMPAMPLVTMSVILTFALFAAGNYTGTSVTFPVVEQGNAMLVRDRQIGIWLCLWNTDARSGRRITHAVAALGVNRIDNVVFSGRLENLPEQLDELFATVSPAQIWIPSDVAEDKIAGLEPQFQGLIQPLRAGEEVSLNCGSSAIMTSSGQESSKSVFVLATNNLHGSAAFARQQPVGASAFTYDLRTGIVTVTTGGQTREYILSETGCLTVSTHEMRCRVAPDARR